MPVKTHKALFDLVYTGFCETPEIRYVAYVDNQLPVCEERGTRNLNLVRVALALAIPRFAKDHGNEVVPVSRPCVGNMVTTRE